MICLMLVNYSKVMQLVKVCVKINVTIKTKFIKKIILEMESSSDDDDLDDSDDLDKESITVNRINI